MKRFFVICLMLILVFATSVDAANISEYNFNMDVNENFSIMTEDNISKNTEYVESLGYTTQSMRKYFSDNNLIMFASNEDNTQQIQVKCTETEFSRQLGELSLLSDESAFEIANQLLPQDYNDDYTLIKQGDMLMFELIGYSKDSGGDFCSIQYITIRDGKLYSIGFFENGNDFSSEFKSIIDKSVSSLSISLKGKITADKAENTAEVIIVWVLIILAAIVVIAVFVSIMSEVVNGKRKDSEKRTVIVRRRYKK